MLFLVRQYLHPSNALGRGRRSHWTKYCSFKLVFFLFPQGIYRLYLEKLDHDSRKEGGQKEGSQNEAGHIAGIERGDTNNERQGACEKQDKDLPEATKENNSDTSTGNEVKDLSLPRSAEETFQQYKLVFYDVNTVSRLGKNESK